MSTRYNLRLRSSAIPSTGPILRRSESPASDVSAERSPLSAIPISEISVSASVATSARSYSSVVACTPPAPSGATGATGLSPLQDIPVLNLGDTDCSNGETVDGLEEEWTTVKRRRARSLDGGLRKQNNVSRQQANAIDEAVRKMTAAERELLRKREQVTRNNARANERPASRGEGPSKGKNPDPRNWGAAGIPVNELDIEAQRAAFESYRPPHGSIETSNKDDFAILQRTVEDDLRSEINLLKKKIRTLEEGSSNSHTEPMKDKTRPHVRTEDMRPSAQIALKSYLGKALDNVGTPRKSSKKSRSRYLHDSGNDSEGENSSETDVDSLPSLETASSTSADSSDSCCRKTHRHRKSRTKKRDSRTLIRPTPPEKYNGAADTQQFHKFISQGTAYVTDGRVPSKRQVVTLSNFLDGKAYTFYTREVSYNPEKWKLKTFFEKLFDYCFPVDFRSRQRKKLRRCYQNDRSVREFVSELNELFTTIGFVDKREKVDKLWYGLRPTLQKALWMERLNPETSSWSSVVEAAEVNEIADSVEVDYQRELREQDTCSDEQGPDDSEDSDNLSQVLRNQFDNSGSTQLSNDITMGALKASSDISFRPRLSEKERNEYQAVNKCFTCGKVGHVSQHCPSRKTTRPFDKNPPGVSAFSLHLEDTERLRNLAATTETLDTLDFGLGAIDFVGTPDARGARAEILTLGRRQEYQGQRGDEVLAKKNFGKGLELNKEKQIYVGAGSAMPLIDSAPCTGNSPPYATSTGILQYTPSPASMSVSVPGDSTTMEDVFARHAPTPSVPTGEMFANLSVHTSRCESTPGLGISRNVGGLEDHGMMSLASAAWSVAVSV